MPAKDKSELLWGMYQENTTQGRHHEVQRQTVTNIVIAIAGAVITLVGLDKAVSLADLPLGLFLTLVGMWGALFSAKYYERFDLHMERARRYRKALDECVPEAQLEELKQEADEAHNSEWPRLHRVRLFWCWIGTHLIVAAIGLIVVVLSMLRLRA
jgi:hypothetical protein